MFTARLLTFIGLLACVLASPFTTNVDAKGKSCFYKFITKPNTDILFYFAVQNGGSFDIDYTIKNPHGEIIAQDEKQSQGEVFLVGQIPGEYELCFSNDMLTYAEKMVDFEIKIDSELGDFKADLPDHPNKKPLSHVENMQKSVSQIDKQLDALAMKLHYYKTRNKRNQATVKSTELRIYYFSIFEVLLMVGMAFLQITIVQLFFKGLRKQLV